MFREAVIFLLLAVIIDSAFTASVIQKCGENEEWIICRTACEPTCGDVPETCPEVCIIGCHCKNGYVKNSLNDCVLPQNC